jgi:hypothetical protein
LFFAPVPTAAAAILAVVTWAGILSQLAVAVWWLAELVRREPPSSVAPAGHDVGSLAPAKVPSGSHTVPESHPDTRDEKGPSSRMRAMLGGACPYCGVYLGDLGADVTTCPHCRRYVQ